MQGMQGRYHVAPQTITDGQAHVRWRSLSRRDARYGPNSLASVGPAEALAERLDRSMRRIAGDHAASRIVVTHGVAGRVFQAIHLGLGWADASRFDSPQDALFCLSDSEIARISYLITKYTIAFATG